MIAPGLTRRTSSCRNLSLGEPKTIRFTPRSASSESSSLLLLGYHDGGRVGVSRSKGTPPDMAHKTQAYASKAPSAFSAGKKTHDNIGAKKSNHPLRVCDEQRPGVCCETYEYELLWHVTREAGRIPSAERGMLGDPSCQSSTTRIEHTQYMPCVLTSEACTRFSAASRAS